MPTATPLHWRAGPTTTITLPTTVPTPAATLTVTLGLASGLSAREGRVFAVTDRGPNIFVSDASERYGLKAFEGVRAERDAKILPAPAMGPEVVELAVHADEVTLVARKLLRASSGAALTGRTPAGEGMERLFDLAGNILPPDPLGADTEAIAAMPDGGFFIAEEYGPSLLKADSEGVVSERWAPAGLEGAFAHPDVRVRGILPERSKLRRGNRGFEALCASDDGAWLYVGFQSALVGDSPRQVPIFKLEAETGRIAAEFSYPFDDPSTFVRDAKRRHVDWSDLKICEFAWAGPDRLIVLERIAHTTKIHVVSLANPFAKKLLFSSDDFPEVGRDMEGMTVLSANELLLASDNDFGVEGAKTEFWRITFDEAAAVQGV